MSGRQTFSESEKFCLQELIIKYRLNLTTTNVSSPAAKKIAWVKLTEEFNSIGSNSKRTEAQLKKLWDNLKTRRKTILATEKRERMKTGGGPYKPIPGTSTQPDSGSVDEALLLDVATDVEIQYVNDSDTVPSQGETLEAGCTVPMEENDDIHYEEIEEDSALSGSCLASSAHATATHSQESPCSGITNRGATTSAKQSQGAKFVRSRVIAQEFNLRKINYSHAQNREEELHQLRLQKENWLILAAKEAYEKAKLERQAAAELLHCNAAKRELAEHTLKENKK